MVHTQLSLRPLLFVETLTTTAEFVGQVEIQAKFSKFVSGEGLRTKLEKVVAMYNLGEPVASHPHAPFIIVDPTGQQ